MDSFASKHRALLLWYLIFLFTPGHGLSPPYDLNWTIDGTCVHLTWKHSHVDEPHNGYYVSVRQVKYNRELAGPDFVHLNSNIRSTDIQGLMPDTDYKVKVIAYSGDVHRSSKSVLMRTTGLELLMAQNLNVTGITATSALFQLKHDAKHTIHDIQFKLTCRGSRQYTDNDNKLIDESDDFNYLLSASSQGKETYYSSTLQPNTKYTCHINTVAETVESIPTKEISFNTLFGPPTPPPRPTVVVHRNSSFSVRLFHSNERFGPISYYKVFGVPMKQETNLQAINARFIPLVASSDLLKYTPSPAVTLESPPVPFLIGSYKYRELPEVIQFDGTRMRLFFKPKTYYSFVTAVFTKSNNEKSEGFHSFSDHSDHPVFISTDLQEDWIQKNIPVAKHFTIIVVCTLIIVISLFTAGFLFVFTTNYYKGRKKDAYFISVVDDDSSEDELYSKPTESISRASDKGTKNEAAPLLNHYPQLSPITSDSSAQESHTDQNKRQSATKNQVLLPPKRLSKSNSPATVPVGSIHSSPLKSPSTHNDSRIPVLAYRDSTQSSKQLIPLSPCDSVNSEGHQTGDLSLLAEHTRSLTTQESSPQTAGAHRTWRLNPLRSSFKKSSTSMQSSHSMRSQTYPHPHDVQSRKRDSKMQHKDITTSVTDH